MAKFFINERVQSKVLVLDIFILNSPDLIS